MPRSDDILKQLEQMLILAAPEALSSPRTSRRRKAVPVLRDEDVDVVLAYLRDPIQVGLWRGTATWQRDAGLSADIWAAFTARLQKHDDGFVLPAVNDQKATRVSLQELSDIREAVFDKVSFILYMFEYLRATSEQSEVTLQRFDSSYSLVAKHINVQSILDNYPGAIEYFTINIYFADFSPIIPGDRPSRSKSGFLLPVDDRSSRRTTVRYVSLYREPVETILKLLQLVGKIDTPKIRRLFSPEDEVFRPYFALVRLVSKRLIEDERLQPLLQRAVEEYQAERYETSIGTLGLVGEDYLTQIYETLFRSQCPRGLTLGQLVDAMQSQVGRVFPQPAAKASDLDAVFSLLNEAIASADASGDLGDAAILTLVRRVAQCVNHERKYNRETFAAAPRKENTLAVFPQQIRDNVNELIRYRNAASHKTRVPLGEFEALRALYCLVSLVMWWSSQLDQVDWSQDVATALRSLMKNSAEASGRP